MAFLSEVTAVLLSPPEVTAVLLRPVTWYGSGCNVIIVGSKMLGSAESVEVVYRHTSI